MPGLSRQADAPTPPTSTFLRGLAVGALVGAAIAGSLLLGGRRRRRDPGVETKRDPKRAPDPT